MRIILLCSSMMSGFLPFLPPMSLLIACECRWKSSKHTHTHKKRATDLSEGALTQDLAQLELLGVGLLRALFHMMRDADLLHRHVILTNSKHRA